MKIVLDAMGGDHAPGEIVQGAIDASAEYGVEVILVGPADLVAEELNKRGGGGGRISVEPASEVIGLDEAPVQAIRRKKDSSLVVGMKLVKEGRGDAFVSAGSTGALMAGGLFILGRLPGIDRPALGAVLPTSTGKGVLILDVGANVDNRPEHLLQFAIMGSIYSEKILGVSRPRVALLNIGTEEAKGNELTKSVYPMLESAQLNFTGNIEGRDVYSGSADVVVCDGFVGNVLLKVTEGLASTLFGMIKEEFTSSLVRKGAAAILKPGLKSIVRRLDYSEYGGAPMLGISSPLIKCHGSSKAKAIKNGLRVAKELVAQGVIPTISRAIDHKDGASNA